MYGTYFLIMDLNIFEDVPSEKNYIWPPYKNVG